MNPVLILICAIIFMIVGLCFCGIAFYLKTPASVEKAPLSAIAGSVFYVIGALTFVTGLLAAIFYKEASKTMIEILFLVYLGLLSAILFFFISMIKTNDGKPSDK